MSLFWESEGESKRVITMLLKRDEKQNANSELPVETQRGRQCFFILAFSLMSICICVPLGFLNPYQLHVFIFSLCTCHWG